MPPGAEEEEEEEEGAREGSLALREKAEEDLEATREAMIGSQMDVTLAIHKAGKRKRVAERLELAVAGRQQEAAILEADLEDLKTKHKEQETECADKQEQLQNWKAEIVQREERWRSGC